jgi:hypothetical protein
MTPAMIKDAEKNPDVSVGALPDLDPIAEHYASMWGTLRASTPADQPISIPSLAQKMEEDEDDFHRALPLMQSMDRVLFDWQRKQREVERKRAEAKAKRQRSKGRR